MKSLLTNYNIPLVNLKDQYQSLKPEIDDALFTVINDCNFIKGEQVLRFEEEFAAYCGTQKNSQTSPIYCASCGNGTDALELILQAIDLEEGDQVITVSNTFIATVEPVINRKAIPVFVDIDPKTYLIDVNQIESKITPRTRAIIAVHLYGQPCDMDAINKIAKKYNLFVIEDAAQAHGAYWKNNRVGTLGDCALFSFFPGKNLGAYGDAGCVISSNQALIQKIKILSNHGRETKYFHHLSGRNSRLDTLQAAILSVKLKYLDQWTKKRQDLAHFYNQNLQKLPISLPKEDKNAESVWHLYVIQTENRDYILQQLKHHNIEAGIHYPHPLHKQPFFEKVNSISHDLPYTEQVSQKILSLPLCPELTLEQAKYIVEKLEKILGAN